MMNLSSPKLSLPFIAGLSILGTAMGAMTPAHATTVSYLQLDPGNSKPGHLDNTSETFAVEFTPTDSTSYLAPSIDADQYAVLPTYKVELPDSGNLRKIDSRWGSASQSGTSFVYGYTFSNDSHHTGVTGSVFGKNGANYDASYVSNLSNLHVTLYRDTMTDSGGYTPGTTLIGSPTALDLSNGKDTFDFAGLTHGIYTLVLSGNFDGTKLPTLSGTIQPVPLPGSVVMFGAALVGLTAFGARRKKG